MMRRKLRLAGFGAPAHAVRITLGHEDRNTQEERVTQKDVDDAADWLASKFVGVTVFPARGRYEYRGGPRRGQMANERSTAFDIVALRDDYPHCGKLKRKMQGAAKQIARRWNQESVMVTVHCADGGTDVTWPMPRYERHVKRKERRRRERKQER